MKSMREMIDIMEVSTASDPLAQVDALLVQALKLVKLQKGEAMQSNDISLVEDMKALATAIQQARRIAKNGTMF
jgi:hypothetical protein